MERNNMAKYTESDLEQAQFRGKYRIPSTRLKNWNYAGDGCYFVTICTKNRECLLGDISKDGGICLAYSGQISRRCWIEIPKHFPFVKLDEFVVMPNHIHGIIMIDKTNENVETQDFASLQRGMKYQNTFGPQSKNLASIIRGFKIGVKKWANKNEMTFYWQTRYYDHVIRDEASLIRIRQYIIDNPRNWHKDRNNLENLYM